MKNTYAIDELYGEAWNSAIEYVGRVIGMDALDIMRKWTDIEDIAVKLGVRFDANGEIIREAK